MASVIQGKSNQLPDKETQVGMYLQILYLLDKLKRKNISWGRVGFANLDRGQGRFL